MFQVPVVYEDGVLKPLKRLRLKEHQKLLISLRVPRKGKKRSSESEEILNDSEQLKRLTSALKNVRRGKLFSHADIFGHPQSSK